MKSEERKIGMEITGPASQINGFRYFWLKYVKGFEQSKHCARCLVGSYSKKIHKTVETNVPIVLDEVKDFDYLYLCGVSPKWETNLHMALKPVEGGKAVVETYNGFKITVLGAELLPIDPLPDGWNGMTKEFTTCRNYQFGVQYYQGQRSVNNTNHPAKGSQIKVDPIKNIKDVKTIKKMLASNPRDFCLFTFGINTNLRASDLLSIKVDMVKDLQIDDEIVLKEKKTGKLRRITLNKNVIESVQNLLDSKEYRDDEFLFKTQKSNVLTVPSVNRLVKGWCKDIKLKGNFGSHTLRKTFGYHQRVTYGVSLPELMEIFNHSTQKQTLTYLCIQPEEIKSIYSKNLL